ncbi:MAG: helix-turn-helix domain-containing protein [Clostridia bacterium]|nr:helix-turn-helix domain-containing protein [Clostridia bacterium]
MAAKEFYINVGNRKIEAFIYDGFLEAKIGNSPLHKHKYTEVHFTGSGESRLIVGTQKYVMRAGAVMAIPQDAIHRLSIDESTFHMAFMINYPLGKVIERSVAPEIIAALKEEILKYKNHSDFTKIHPYLSLFCKDIVDAKVDLLTVTNREFIIHEFFENRYNEDVTILDLAKELNLSTKQTSRLVEKYIGSGFSIALTSYRLNAAKQLLISDKSLTMSDVAELVGYRSYSGFWKAFKNSK